jgi:hypothetical protein
MKQEKKGLIKQQSTKNNNKKKEISPSQYFTGTKPNWDIIPDPNGPIRITK